MSLDDERLASRVSVARTDLASTLVLLQKFFDHSEVINCESNFPTPPTHFAMFLRKIALGAAEIMEVALNPHEAFDPSFIGSSLYCLHRLGSAENCDHRNGQ